MATKEFHISGIISAYTHILVGDFNDVYHVFNHLTQDDLFTHQILVACKLMRDEIARQLPWVTEVDATGLEGEVAVYAFVDKMAEKYGEFHVLESAEHLWANHDWLTDLEDIRKGKYSG